MKITIPVMHYKRHAVFAAWAQSIWRLQNSFPNIQFDVLVAGSEGPEVQAMVESWGFDYIEVPNRPLGRKANLRFAAAKEYKADYVLLMSSDTIISNASLSTYLHHAQAGAKEIVGMDLYYYIPAQNKLVYTPGQTSGKPIAPGRMLAYDLCEKMEWTGWNEVSTHHIDGPMHEKLESIGHKRALINCKEAGIFNMELRTNIQITPFKWRSHYSNAPIQLLKKFLSAGEIKTMKNLKNQIDDSDKWFAKEHLTKPNK